MPQTLTAWQRRGGGTLFILPNKKGLMSWEAVCHKMQREEMQQNQAGSHTPSHNKHPISVVQMSISFVISYF